MQQLLWSGSLISINNPALINRLRLLDYFDEFGRLYLPQTIFQFNDANPLHTIVCLPRATTPSEEPFVAAQLALSHRCFRRAFGGGSTEFLRIFKSYSSILQLFLLPRNSFFTPLYNSKTHIMAANLLNAFFGDLFRAMEVDDEQHLLLFAQLCFATPELPPSLPIQIVSASVNASVLLENIFQLNGVVPDCLLDTSFAKLWRMAFSIIPYLNT